MPDDDLYHSELLANIRAMIRDELKRWRPDLAQTFNTLPGQQLPPAQGSGGGTTPDRRGGIILSDSAPASIGPAAAGTSAYASRGDHVHPILLSDATTSTAPTVANVVHRTSGTPVAGFGGALGFQLKSDTTNDRDAAQVAAAWTDPADATRSGALTFGTVFGAGAMTERMRISKGVAIGSTTFPVGMDAIGNLYVNGNFRLTGSFTFPDQSSNTVFAGPTTGAAATPGFRNLVAADLPVEAVQRASAATAGRVAFWSGASQISHSADLTWDDTNKLVQIGAATALTTGLFLTGTITETSAGNTRGGAVFETTFSPGASQVTVSKTGAAVYSLLDGSGGTSAAGALQGLLLDTRHRQTAGTMSGLVIGLNSAVRVTGAGSAGTVYGIRAIPLLSSSGNMTDWRAFYADGPSLSSTGTITTAYGLYVTKQKVTGVTTGYGVFQSDSADINSFAGDVTASRGLNVGSATGAATGEVRASAALYPSSGTGSAQFQSRDIVSLANNGTAQLVNATGDEFGVVFVMDGTNGQIAIYILRGGGHATQEVSDPGAVYTNTAGSAASTNIYWSAGNTRYELENKIGSAQTYHVLFFKY